MKRRKEGNKGRWRRREDRGGEEGEGRAGRRKNKLEEEEKRGEE